jgi:hypothetical protein
MARNTITMKKIHAPIAAIVLFLTIASCKKDFQETTPVSEPSIETSALSIDNSKVSSKGISESEWQANTSWTAVERPSHSVFFTNIKSDISVETAEQGLIRVVKTNGAGNSVQSLPFEENINGVRHYWYYQVTEGNVMIAVDVYGSKNNPAEKSLFKSVVLTKDAVAEQETKGNTKAQLMSMPVETITAL